MEAGTSTLHPSFHAGPGSSHTQAQSSAGSTVPEDHQTHQTHHKPFFYVQPSQPFLPMQQGVQWPMSLMPLNYSPYYGGYPGFGYGLPLMPHFQPGPFMEAPGFVVPHTHLHLMDYRRMLNPQYYQSMAYHARRMRYQQHAPQRDVTSSEVQTEPLPASPRTNISSLNQSETSREVPSLSTAVSVQNEDRTMALNELAPVSTNATPQKGSFVIETEEVRIQCCATPAGLQVMHSHDSSEMSRRFAQNVVHCSSIVQNSLTPEEDSQIVDTEGNSQMSHQACPDILIVAPPNNNELNQQMEKTPTNHQRIKMATNVDAIRSEKDLKVVRLPFDPRYLDELRKIESTVWSMEDTLVPSPEFLIESCDETLRGETPSAEMLASKKEMAQEKVLPIVNLSKSIGKDLKEVELMDTSLVVQEVLKQACIDGKMESKYSQNLMFSEDLPMDGALQEPHDTSFESLPAYLPSSSWLADFENVSYGNLPIQKLNKQLANRSLDLPLRCRKPGAEFKDVTAIRKPKQKYKQTRKVDRRSLSDHECCVSRSYNENALISYADKTQRLCMRCSSKQRVYKTSASPTQAPKRKFVPFQPRNDLILPTCQACKDHVAKRVPRKGSSPDTRMETEGESSENSCRRKKMVEELKRPLAVKQNVEKSPGTFPKLRERNCLCGELHQPQIQSKWQRIYHCPHGNAIRETDENRAVKLSPEPWRSKEPTYLTHRWQTERPWKTMPGHNMETFKNDLLRAQHTTLHKKSLPLSQGLYRRDTRC